MRINDKQLRIPSTLTAGEVTARGMGAIRNGTLLVRVATTEHKDINDDALTTV